jgi:hypothetical protein
MLVLPKREVTNHRGATPWKEDAMEKFIRRENLIIFKRRLAEAETDTQRQMLLKLLAEEEARGLIVDAPSR